MDIYQNASEVEEATAFIKENTRRLLSVEEIKLYPVSAQSALEAKIAALDYSGRNYGEFLFSDPWWKSSEIYELEKFLFSFLDGSTDNGIERMRLKLETPIGIADRLLISCVRIVKQDYQTCIQEFINMEEAVESVDAFAMRVKSDFNYFKSQVSSRIESARTRTTELAESTLRLSNIDLITTYALKGERSVPLPVTSTVQDEIINPAINDTQGRPLWNVLMNSGMALLKERYSVKK